jgi:hypothetical protein
MAESFVLNTGATIPSVGLGVWQITPEAVGKMSSLLLSMSSGLLSFSPEFPFIPTESRMFPGCLLLQACLRLYG